VTVLVVVGQTVLGVYITCVVVIVLALRRVLLLVQLVQAERTVVVVGVGHTVLGV
jgi:hypothetical protein